MTIAKPLASILLLCLESKRVLMVSFWIMLQASMTLYLSAEMIRACCRFHVSSLNPSTLRGYSYLGYPFDYLNNGWTIFL